MNKRSISIMVGTAVLVFLLIFVGLFYCGKFIIQDAVRHGHLTEVKILVWINPDLVNNKDTYGNTPLHIAANLGWPEEAAFLLAKKSDVNAKSNDGSTPLLCALYGNNQQMAELLLTHGAEVNCKNNRDESPLHRAAGNANKDMVEMLLANKADIRAKDNDGMTSLHWAAEYADKELADLLITNKADINARDNNGDTPLHLAEIRKPNQYHHMSQEFLDMEKKDITDLVEFLHKQGGQE